MEPSNLGTRDRSCHRTPRKRKLIALLTDGNVVRRILEHLGLPTTAPTLAPARSPDEAITAATLNAACSLWRGDRLGSLEVGKRANLVVHAVPNRHHLVYRFGVPRVSHVVAVGDVVVDAPRLPA